MDPAQSQRTKILARSKDEWGPHFVPGMRKMALAYPSPYHVGMSSLGYQQILRVLRNAGIHTERCFLPEDMPWNQSHQLQPITEETLTPLNTFPIIGISLAYELELAGLISLLTLAGIPPLRKDRGEHDPIIILGGPLTFSNPLPAAPFVDVILLGEAEETTPLVVQHFFDCERRETWLNTITDISGVFIPERQGTTLPPIAKATDTSLPARSTYFTPHTELSNMFLLEGERGCHRTCTFCVMRRSTNGGMRLVSPETILDIIPDAAPKVGLVGAAISDHPRLVDILETLVESGRGIGVSSLRADRVVRRPRIAELLRKSGAKTLTVASDAASKRLRRLISKGTVEHHLEGCADIAHTHDFDILKIYMMLGVPGEEDVDLDELIAFSLALRKRTGRTRIALGIAPFVAKKNTPLDGEPYAGIKEVDRRIMKLKRGLKGAVEVRPTSSRWAWVEYQLAQGGPEAGLAVLQAVQNGGHFADYKRAFTEMGTETMRPWAVPIPATHPINPLMPRRSQS